MKKGTFGRELAQHRLEPFGCHDPASCDLKIDIPEGLSTSFLQQLTSLKSCISTLSHVTYTHKTSLASKIPPQREQ